MASVVDFRASRGYSKKILTALRNFINLVAFVRDANFLKPSFCYSFSFFTGKKSCNIIIFPFRLSEHSRLGNN
jgi:hypothetical protein